MKLSRLRRRLRRRTSERDRQHRLWERTGKRGHAKAAAKDAAAIRYLRSLVRKLTKRRAKHREGVDWAYGTISPEALKAAGKSFVCRYLSYTPPKNLDAEEAKRYAEAGIDCVVVWETTGKRATASRESGRRDATNARRQARACGKPARAPIFFAVDFGALGPELEEYFRGVADVLGTAKAGVYGGYAAVKYLLDKGLVHWAWQTYAWSNGSWDPRAHLRQYLNGAHVAGVEVDLDRTTAAEFGQWRSTLA